MAQAGIRLVYGAGSHGLMGEVARAVLSAGGHVTGIIPESLTSRENPLRDLDEMIITRDLHERKMLMFKKADAFVALPGGIGTLEELVEQLTWVQLRHHDKPVVVVNVENYWDPLLHLFDQMRRERFIRDGLEPRFFVVDHVEKVLPLLRHTLVDDQGVDLDKFA